MKKLFIFAFLFLFSFGQVTFAQLDLAPQWEPSNNFSGINRPPTAPNVTNITIDPAQAGTGQTVPSILCALPGDMKIQDILNYGTCLVFKSFVPLVLGFSFLVFVWGVFQFVAGAQEEAKREKGRQFIIWGLIAMSVIVSIYSLINVISGSFGIQSAGPKVEVDSATPQPINQNSGIAQ
jgi:hypothetical protein